MTSFATSTTRENGTQVVTINGAEDIIQAQDDFAPVAINPVFKNVFHYAGFCELNAKNNIENLGADVIDTTFTSDLSIAEFCEQAHLGHERTTEAVEDTIQRATREWADNSDYITALLFAVNMKSWEHYAMTDERNASVRAFPVAVHEQYAKYYADRYHELYDYVMDELFAGDEHEDDRYHIWKALD